MLMMDSVLTFNVPPRNRLSGSEHLCLNGDCLVVSTDTTHIPLNLVLRERNQTLGPKERNSP